MLDFAGEQAGIQRQQADSGYRRAVADLKLAGLNPMLAFKNGPLGTGGTVGTPQLENFAASGINSANRVLEAANLKAQNEKLAAETENVRADTLIKLEQPAWWKASTATQTEETSRVRSEQQRLSVEYNRLLQEVDRIKLEKDKLEFYNTHIQPIEAALRNTEYDLLELERPKATAMAGSWRGDYATNIRPYLQDLAIGGNSALDIIRSMRGGFAPRSTPPYKSAPSRGNWDQLRMRGR